MRLVLGILSALAVLLGASAAAAGQGECLWEHMPQAKRDQLLAMYERSLEEGLQANLFTEEEFEAAATACGNPDARHEGLALSGYEVELQARLWFAKSRNIDEAALDRAWPHVADDLRESLGASVRGDKVAGLERSLNEFARLIGLTDEERRDAYSEPMRRARTYLQGRSGREGAEAGIQA